MNGRYFNVIENLTHLVLTLTERLNAKTNEHSKAVEEISRTNRELEITKDQLESILKELSELKHNTAQTFLEYGDHTTGFSPGKNLTILPAIKRVRELTGFDLVTAKKLVMYAQEK